MEFNLHTISFSIWIVICLISGGWSGARYSYLREAKCLEYVKCPDVMDSTSHYNYESSHQCVKIKDLSGIESIGDFDIVSSPLINLPYTCWTDGFNVATNDPKVVLKWVIISAFLILPISYIIINIIIHYCRMYNLNKYGRLAFYKSMFPFEDVYPTYVTIGIIISIITIGYVSGMIYFAFYNLHHREVTCTGYHVRVISGINTFVDSANWKDINNITGTYVISLSSFQPSILPEPCWIDNTSLSFYNPKTLYISATIIYGIVLAVCLLYMLTTHLIKKIIVKQINTIEYPPFKYITTIGDFV
ncbi:MAG: hypothetical protein Edafosvirus3_73 [Edafosvirus sp.]|uniref:Uncharacterized protein n=1 Tax=Edafosvirus sp. TaxID=2487765 RepID=A0A3G4ZSY0_9VIRU|nr:MAG: hypothetical protein Edafosvirus3_73 [Edafosvirus sp.]